MNVNSFHRKFVCNPDNEVELVGETYNFVSLINEVANEINVPDYVIEIKSETKKDDNDFLYYNVFSINRRNAHRTLIGVLTLKSIGTKRTILRIPPRSQWMQRIQGDNLARASQVLANEDNKFKDQLEMHFSIYVNALVKKLKHYRLVKTWYMRLWLIFKEFIGIAKIFK